MPGRRTAEFARTASGPLREFAIGHLAIMPTKVGRGSGALGGTEERLNLLADLERKYGATLAESGFR